MNILKKIRRRINLWLYFKIASKLPCSYDKGGKFAKKLREKLLVNF